MEADTGLAVPFFLNQQHTSVAGFFPYGRVMYEHGGGLDAPLGVVRMENSDQLHDAQVIAPHATWRGTYDRGTPITGQCLAYSTNTHIVEADQPAKRTWLPHAGRVLEERVPKRPGGRNAQTGAARMTEIATYVCSHIFDSTRAVLLVAREDGDWMFLCGASHDENEQYHLVGMNHLLKRDSTLTAVLTLPDNFEGERDAVGTDWHWRPLADD